MKLYNVNMVLFSSHKKYFLRGFIFLLIFAWVFSGWPQLFGFPPRPHEVEATVTTLDSTACEDTSTPSTDCQAAISADGGTTYAVAKGAWIDAYMETLSGVSSINSVTVYYDHGPSVISGTYKIEVYNVNSYATPICALDPAVEASSEQTNSFTCGGITPTDLSQGIIVDVYNEDDKSPESITIDYLRVQVDYEPTSTSAPTVSTSAATSIGTDSATLNGNITATGGEDATQHGFAYGTDSTLATVIATTTLGSKTGTGTFNESVGSLSSNTTYYFRAYATNSGGTGYGSILNFTTDAITYSVTVTSSGIITYGAVGLSTSSSTVGTGFSQSVQNDGGVSAQIDIKSSDATGGTTWTLGTSPGSNIFKHEFSTSGGESWTTFEDSSTYYTIGSSLGSGSSISPIDFRITTPSSSGDYQEKSITITVQASAPAGPPPG